MREHRVQTGLENDRARLGTYLGRAGRFARGARRRRHPRRLSLGGASASLPSGASFCRRPTTIVPTRSSSSTRIEGPRTRRSWMSSRIAEEEPELHPRRHDDGGREIGQGLERGDGVGYQARCSGSLSMILASRSTTSRVRRRWWAQCARFLTSQASGTARSAPSNSRATEPPA